MSAAASFDIDDSKQPQPKPAPAVRRSMSSMSSMSDSAGSAGWEVVAQEFAGVPYQETAVATPKPNARSRGRPRKNNVIRPIEGAVSPAAIVAVQAIAPAARACQAMEVYGSAQREQIQQFTDAMQRTHISLSPLQQYLFAAARDPAEEAEPKQIADDQDDWDGALLERFLQAVLRPERPVAAAAVLEQQLKSRVSNFIEVVGSAFTEAGLGQWDLFLRACVTQLRDGKARGLFFIRQRYYDETPLRLRHKADGEQPRITKVLQSHLRLGLVMEDAVTQQISCYFGHVPTWLQALQEAKGEDILAAQLQIEGSLSFLDVCSESFASTLQLVTTDRAGSNYKAETGFQHLKPHAKKLHLPCDVHKTSVATTTMFSLASGMLTAMVNYGLMFRAAGSLAKFRLCLMEEIESNFRLVIGMRPAFAAAYQAEVFHVFLNNSHSNSDVQRQQQASRAWQKQVLSFFMNGDLQDETVTWYAPFDVTREQALKLFRTFVPRALLPRCVPVFPRHRWHGCEVPLDALGLVASHCNLLQRATKRFLRGFDAGHAFVAPEPRKPQQEVQGSGWHCAATQFLSLQSEVPGAEAAHADGAGHAQQSRDGDEDDAVAVVLESGSADPVVAAGQASEPGFWDKFNRSVRGKVAKWASGDEFYLLALMRIALSPVLHTMFQFLRLASRQWECQQEACMLKNGFRKYRILEAFKGDDVAKAFQDLFQVLIRRIPAIPSHWYKRSVCVLLFRFVARVSAALHQLLRIPRRGFPYKLFACLSATDESIQAVRRAAPCTRDEFSNDFLCKFTADSDEREHGLLGARAQTILSLIATLSLVDISCVESKHATIRRVLEASSVQTWRASLAKLSAEFTVRQTCSRRSELMKTAVPISITKRKPGPKPRTGCKRCLLQRKKSGLRAAANARVSEFGDGEAAPKRKYKIKKRKSGGGGGCRAFLSERLRQPAASVNKAQRLRLLHQQYRNLAEADRARYDDIGAVATVAHRQGHRAFGPVFRSTTFLGLKRKKPMPSTIPRLEWDMNLGRVEKFRCARSQKQQEVRRQDEVLMQLGKFARSQLGLPESEPVGLEEGFERALQMSSLPRAQSYPCCEVLPPNAKLAKDCGTDSASCFSSSEGLLRIGPRSVEV